MSHLHIVFMSLFADAPDTFSRQELSKFRDNQYLLFSRVPKCGTETTLDLIQNISKTNGVTVEIHKTLKYFDHQKFSTSGQQSVSFRRSHVAECTNLTSCN